MADVIKGNFAADGSSDTVVATKLTVLVGNSSATNFGGGTVTIEAEYGDSGEFTSIYSFTEEGAQTTNEFAGGARFKLTLAGATSPDLDYTIAYE